MILSEDEGSVGARLNVSLQGKAWMGSQVGWTSSCELTCQTFIAREKNGKRGLGEGEKDDGSAKEIMEDQVTN